MIDSTVYRRYAGGGWGWTVVFGPGDAPEMYTGYARTQLGARFAVWNLSRPTLWSWLSYAIRPYDGVRDGRRWFFQRRQRCGFFR